MKKLNMTLAAVALTFVYGFTAVEVDRDERLTIPLKLPTLSEGAKWVDLDPIEVECVSLNIYFESRNQNEADKTAVGHVPFNRLNRPMWKHADGVCDIIYQRDQFSWYWDGKPDTPEPNEMREWFTSLRIAEEILRGELPDPTNGADHYHAYYVTPDWSEAYTHVARFDDHLFYNSTL